MNEFWETNLTDLLHYLLTNVIILGLIGNIICFKVFSTPALQKHPISFFFKVIAVFDFIMMFNGINFFALQKLNFDLSLKNDIFCKLNSYFEYATGPISPWIMVIVSLDRFICVCYPKMFLFRFKFRFQLVLVFIIIGYNYIFYSFILWNNVLIEGKILINRCYNTYKC